MLPSHLLAGLPWLQLEFPVTMPSARGQYFLILQTWLQAIIPTIQLIVIPTSRPPNPSQHPKWHQTKIGPNRNSIFSVRLFGLPFLGPFLEMWVVSTLWSGTFGGFSSTLSSSPTCFACICRYWMLSWWFWLAFPLQYVLQPLTLKLRRPSGMGSTTSKSLVLIETFPHSHESEGRFLSHWVQCDNTSPSAILLSYQGDITFP